MTLWKYVKLAYISVIQYGMESMTVPMKSLLHHFDRKGLSFIQAITLWRIQDEFRGMAATESHQA